MQWTAFSVSRRGATIFPFKKLLSYPHEVEWTPFQTHHSTENLVAPGIEPGACRSVAMNSNHQTTEAFIAHKHRMYIYFTDISNILTNMLIKLIKCGLMPSKSISILLHYRWKNTNNVMSKAVSLFEDPWLKIHQGETSRNSHSVNG
jgi:hypothetical protein